jgi:hypothetical protein
LRAEFSNNLSNAQGNVYNPMAESVNEFKQKLKEEMSANEESNHFSAQGNGAVTDNNTPQNSQNDKNDLMDLLNRMECMGPPFNCTECNYTSTQVTNLRQHIKAVHHKIKDFSCTLCPYKSARKSTLALHLKSRHSSIDEKEESDRGHNEQSKSSDDEDEEDDDTDESEYSQSGETNNNNSKNESEKTEIKTDIKTEQNTDPENTGGLSNTTNSNTIIKQGIDMVIKEEKDTLERELEKEIAGVSRPKSKANPDLSGYHFNGSHYVKTDFNCPSCEFKTPNKKE